MCMLNIILNGKIWNSKVQTIKINEWENPEDFVYWEQKSS